MIKQTQLNSLNDLELINVYNSEQNRNAVGVLFKRYTRFVFLVSMKYLKDTEESQDAVMQIFEKLFTDLKKHEISNFKAWLHTVTRNHCLILLRNRQAEAKKQNSYEKDEQEFVEFATFEHLKDENQKEDRLSSLEDAIKLLNPEQKECIDLFYLKEKSYVEISQITGYDIKKVKSYIQNGKRNIKNLMTDKALILILILLNI